MREESQRLSKAEKTITKDETQEDTTIKKLDEERKALRNKDVKSDREKIQYAELNITVKKMRRTRARRKKKEHVEKILASGRGPKEALRGNGRKVIGELRTENNKIVTNNEGQRGRVVSASDSGSGGRGFDSRPSHVVIALGKQFTLTFPSPPTCKMGTQLQFVICAYNILHMG